MNLNKVCRTCLLEKRDLKPLFEASVAKMLMYCTSLVLVEGDGLPSQICKQCVLMVSRAFNFKQQCEKSDANLRQFISNNKFSNHLSCLQENVFVQDTCSVYTDMFTKSDSAIAGTLDIDHSTLSTDVTELADTMQSMAEQCLPVLWGLKHTSSIVNSQDNNVLTQDAFVNDTLQIDDCTNKDIEWTELKPMKQNYSCLLCAKYFDDPLTLSQHMDEHNNGDKSEKICCELCGKIVADLKNHKEHMKEHCETQAYVERKYQCSACGKSYSQNKYLMIHMRSHSGERPLHCELCNKSFALPSSLHRHKLTHNVNKKYKCSVCNKGFNQTWNLHAHMRTHLGLKTHACVICDKKYASQRTLDVHLRAHTGDKPYGCEACERAFTTKTLLKKHSLTHTSEKPYVCPQCGKCFRYKESLSTHVRYHTGERPYTCAVCSKSFIARAHLYTHRLRHSGERRHQCAVCHKRFTERGSLKVHLRTHSPGKVQLSHLQLCHNDTLC